MLSSTNRFVSTTEREKDFIDVLEENGIQHNPRFVQRGSYSFRSGYQSMQYILSGEERPTAVLSIADTVAAGAMQAVYEAGLRVPKDMAVIGFDNIDLCQMLIPQLATMAQPRHQLEVTAVELLLEKIGHKAEHKRVYLPYELILGGSTR